MTGDHMLTVLGALANMHRLRIIASLQSAGRNYVSQLARDVGLSRPLLHLHLQKLKEAGLVRSQVELSADNKALSYFEVTDFFYELSPATIAQAVTSMTLANINLEE
jgi:DNA-binding transcriptional ArsR family regulator